MTSNGQPNGTTELRFGLSIAVTIIGLVIGCLVAAFVVGFRSGHTSGYEEATRASLASVPRFKISDSEQPEEVSKEMVSKVYERLKKKTELQEGEEKDVPELGVINQVKPPVVEMPKAKQPSKEANKDIAKVNEENSLDILPKEVSLKDVAVPKTKDKNIDSLLGANTQIKEEAKPATLGGLFELGNSGKPDDDVRSKSDQGLKNENESSNLVKQQPQELAAVQQIVTEKPQNKDLLEEAKTAIEPKLLPPQEENLRKGWYVQVAAPKSQQEANTMLEQLKNNGFRDSTLQTAVIKGEVYYRVLVGPEDTALLAQRLLEQVGREPYVKFKPFLKRVQG